MTQLNSYTVPVAPMFVESGAPRVVLILRATIAPGGGHGADRSSCNSRSGGEDGEKGGGEVWSQTPQACATPILPQRGPRPRPREKTQGKGKGKGSAKGGDMMSMLMAVMQQFQGGQSGKGGGKKGWSTSGKFTVDDSGGVLGEFTGTFARPAPSSKSLEA